MVRYARLQYEVEIPEDITVTVTESTVTVKGKLGELTKNFDHTGIRVEKLNDKIVLTTVFPRKREKALIGTVQAHIKNMFTGVTYGYRYAMKIVFSHFPIRVKTEGSKVKIENLYGGRKPKYAKVLPGVKVEVDSEDVFVEGIEKEAVGQTCANIQELTRQRGKRRQSPKTFMDGIFTYEKSYIHEPEAA